MRMAPLLPGQTTTGVHTGDGGPVPAVALDRWMG